MKHPRIWATLAVLGWMGAALYGAAPSNANPIADCYTQTTYNGGSRTTCYSGYPDYQRSITFCDGRGRCTIDNPDLNGYLP